MASNEVGSVGFGLELGASDNGLLKTLKQVTSAMESLDKSVNSLSSKMDGSFKSMEQSASKAAKATSTGMRNVEKSITPTLATLDKLQEKYADVSKSSQRIGDGAKNMKSVEQAMRSYTQMVEQGFTSTQQLASATGALTREMSRAQQENQKFERAMLSVQKSVSGAERQVATMTRRMQAMGDSEKPVNELTQALQRYKNEMTDAAGDAIATAKAQERFANSTDHAKRELEEMNDRLRRYSRETDNARRGTGNLSGAMGALIASTGAFVSAYNAVEILRMADQYTEMANRLAVVSMETANVAGQMRTLLDVAIDARSSLDGVTDVYSKLTRANERYGKSQEEILSITTAVSQAVSMSGATAQGAQGALIQFSQAISNNFQAAAQEINSINEQTPALSQAIALALTSTGKYGEVAANDLKRLASEGRLSAGDLLDGFVNVADQIEERFGQATLTMAQGFVALKDSAVTSLGEVGRATGITESIAKAMQDLAKSSEEAAAGIAGIGAGLGTLAASIGVAGIVGLFAIMGPVATAIAGVGVAVSVLAGIFVSEQAKVALFEQRMEDLRDGVEATRNSMFGLTNDKYSWEDSSFNAWLKDSNDAISDTRSEITSLEADITRLVEQSGSGFLDEILVKVGATVGIDLGSRAEQSEIAAQRLEREIQLEAERALKLEQAIELAKRFNDERFGSLTGDMNEALASINRENDAQLVAISSVKSAAEDYYRFVTENADKSLLDVRRVQIAEGLLRDLGFEADNIGVVIDSNKDVIDAALVMMAQGFSSTEEVVAYLNNNLNTNAELVANSEEEIASLYQGMNNASGATARFSAEVARLGTIMAAAAATGNTEMVGMIRDIIIEMNKQYNKDLENIAKGDQSRKKAEKSIDSLVNKYHELNDVLEQQAALSSSGIEGVLDLQALQEEEESVRELEKAFSELSSKGLADFIEQTGVVTQAGESVADAVIRMSRESANFEDELKKQEAANKTVTDSLDDMLNEYEEATLGLEALKIGTEEYERVMTSLQIARQVDEISEAFNNLNAVDQAIQIQRISEAFGLVGVTADNLPAKLEEAKEKLAELNREGERQSKITEAAEKEARRFQDAWDKGMDNVADTFKDGLLNMEDGFSGFADSLKNSFKNLLLDLAYEAYIRPIVVGFQSDMSGMMGMGGGSPGGGFGGTINAVKGAYSSFMGGSTVSATPASLGMQGGVSGTAITSANQVATGGTSAFASGVQGLMSMTPQIAAAYAVGQMIQGGLEDLGVFDAIGSPNGPAAEIGGQLGGIVGRVVGGWGDALFGSEETPFRGNFGTTEFAPQGTFEHDTYNSASTLGHVGFLDQGTQRLQRAGFEGYQWAQDLADSAAQMDNLVASLAEGDEQLNAMRETVQSMSFRSGDAGEIFDFALVERPLAALRSVGFEVNDALESAILDLDIEESVAAVQQILSMTQFGETIGGSVTDDIYDILNSVGGGLEDAFVKVGAMVDSIVLLSGSAERLNLQFDATSEGALLAAGNIANFAGGIENLAALQSSYYQTYFTEAERAANLQDDLTASLSNIGMELPSTLQGFRDLVEAQDLNTEAGQQNYAQLLQLASGFNDLTISMKSQLEAVYQSALGRQADADGLAYWMDQVASGTLSLEDAFWNITNSTESLKNQLESAYQDVLGREADTAGITYWMDQISSGALTLEDAFWNIANSVEALNNIDFTPLDDAMSLLSDAVEREREVLQQAHDLRISDLQSQSAELQAASDVIRNNAQNAFSKLQESVNKEIAALQSSFESSRTSLQARITEARSESSELTSLVNTLAGALNRMSNSSDERNLITVGQSQVSLDAQTMSGVFNQDQIESAIQGLSQNSTSLYRSMEDFERSQLLAENSLSSIRDSAESQLSSEERMINALESQLESLQSNHSSEVERLNGIVENSQLQLDKLLGIDNSVLTVEQAVASFNTKASEDNILLLESNTRQQSLIEREILTLEQNHSREMKRLDGILENAQLQVDGLNGVDKSLMSVSRAMYEFDSTLRSIRTLLANQNSESLPGYSTGGVASGPKSGYPVELHGTEAIIPLGNGNIPIELLTPMPSQSSGGITNIITHQYEQKESSRSDSSEDGQDIAEILSVLREMGEISYEQLVILNKVLKINQRFQIEGIKTQE